MFVPPIFWQFWFDGILHARKIPLVDSKKKTNANRWTFDFFSGHAFLLQEHLQKCVQDGVSEPKIWLNKLTLQDVTFVLFWS